MGHCIFIFMCIDQRSPNSVRVITQNILVQPLHWPSAGPWPQLYFLLSLNSRRETISFPLPPDLNPCFLCRSPERDSLVPDERVEDSAMQADEPSRGDWYVGNSLLVWLFEWMIPHSVWCTFSIKRWGEEEQRNSTGHYDVL